MSEQTNIEWCDSTFNAWIGCMKVSDACDNCYAEVSTPARTRKVIWGVSADRVRTAANNWKQPIRWNRAHDEFFAEHGRRRRVFSASLSDWLDNAVPVEWLADLLELVHSTPNLDWLLLSKRIGNWFGRLNLVAQLLREQGGRESLLQWVASWLGGFPPANVWLGSSIPNQPEADRDIIKLLRVPAAVRFLSMEPLLGPVDLTHIDLDGDFEFFPLKGTTNCENYDGGPEPDLPRIDWVIVGGESGANARPMHPDWVRSLRDQCEDAGVAFLFKQWGEWTPGENVDRATGIVDGAFWVDGRWMPSRENLASDDGHRDDEPELYRVGKKAAGRRLDGITWSQYPR